MYQAAVERLGKLEFDECFGFTPLLGLGGFEKPEFLDKVKIKEHIAIICYLVGPVGGEDEEEVW